MQEIEKEAEFREGNISLILENYNDLFSSFDPRDYSEKSLSDDFLAECKRAARDKELGFELNLLIPSKKREFKEEIKIKKRLISHFQRHFQEKEREIRFIQKQGVMWFILGALIMFGATFLYERTEFLLKFLFIIAEPAGWFTFWEGLDKIFIVAAEKKPEYIFYKKMARAKINFKSY